MTGDNMICIGWLLSRPARPLGERGDDVSLGVGHRRRCQARPDPRRAGRRAEQNAPPGFRQALRAQELLARIELAEPQRERPGGELFHDARERRAAVAADGQAGVVRQD
jgi:hypothetical protein